MYSPSRQSFATSPRSPTSTQVFLQTRPIEFNRRLVADEVDYNISGRVSKKAVDELVAAGNLEKLAQLLANEDEDENNLDCTL